MQNFTSFFFLSFFKFEGQIFAESAKVALSALSLSNLSI